MNIFKIILSGLFVFALTVINTYAAELRIEEAIESASLKISMDAKSGTGVVYGKVCDQCEKLTLIITPQSLAFEGNTQVALAKAKGRLGQYATVIFDKKTLEVIRFHW